MLWDKDVMACASAMSFCRQFLAITRMYVFRHASACNSILSVGTILGTRYAPGDIPARNDLSQGGPERVGPCVGLPCSN